MIPAVYFFHTFGVTRLPKGSGPPDNFLPELLASAKDFFIGNLSHPFPWFLSPSSLCVPYHPALLLALHFLLLSLLSPTMASTLHTATAFWLLLPCDFLCLHTQSDTRIAGRSGIPLRYAFLSPAVGKQSLLASPHFPSLLTFPLSLYNFIFPPEKSPVVCFHFFVFFFGPTY